VRCCVTRRYSALTRTHMRVVLALYSCTFKHKSLCNKYFTTKMATTNCLFQYCEQTNAGTQKAQNPLHALSQAPGTRRSVHRIPSAKFSWVPVYSQSDVRVLPNSTQFWLLQQFHVTRVLTLKIMFRNSESLDELIVMHSSRKHFTVEFVSLLVGAVGTSAAECPRKRSLPTRGIITKIIWGDSGE
jgi:hypothetical protein